MAGPDFEGRRSASADAALASFLDLDDLLRRALAYAAEAAGAGSCRILLHDPEAREFVVAAADEEARGRRFPDTAGVPGAVFTSGQAQIGTRVGAHASMAAPLNGGDRT